MFKGIISSKNFRSTFSASSREDKFHQPVTKKIQEKELSTFLEKKVSKKLPIKYRFRILGKKSILQQIDDCHGNK